jgi:hypothetical protein
LFLQNSNSKIYFNNNIFSFYDQYEIKLVHEINVDSCLFYYGFIKENKTFTDNNECITIVDDKKQIFYNIKMKSKEMNMFWYDKLFKLVYASDTPVYFDGNHLPIVKPSKLEEKGEEDQYPKKQQTNDNDNFEKNLIHTIKRMSKFK